VIRWGENRRFFTVRKRAAHGRSVLARAAIVGVLATTLCVVPPSAAMAATTTTITFDDLAPGTKVSTQYGTQGVDFSNGIVGLNVYCYPVVVTVASGQAESGDQVADTSCANGEFPDSSIKGVLKSSAQNVSSRTAWPRP
jgi:hypothetical protein